MIFLLGRAWFRSLVFANRASLDAPLVAVGWFALSLGRFDDSSEVITAIVLGLTVWLIYVADRLLDARSLDHSRSISDRHLFSHRYFSALHTCWWLGLSIDVILVVVCLAPELYRFGILMASLVIVYLILVHQPLRHEWTSGTPSRVSRWLPKELMVGALFAAGVVVPAAIHRESAGPITGHGTAVMILLSGAFTLNCLLVAWCDASVDDGQSTPSVMTRYPALGDRLWVLGLVLCVLAVVMVFLEPETRLITCMILIASACMTLLALFTGQATAGSPASPAVALSVDWLCAAPAWLAVVMSHAG